MIKTIWIMIIDMNDNIMQYDELQNVSYRTVHVYRLSMNMSVKFAGIAESQNFMMI